MFIWLPQNDFDISPTNLGSQDPLYNILSSSDTVIQSVDEWEKGILCATMSKYDFRWQQFRDNLRLTDIGYMLSNCE